MTAIMKDWLPGGYEPHEVPPDYTGPLFLESQMRYAYYQGIEKTLIEIESLRAEMQDLNIRLGLEIGRKNEEIKRLQAEAEQYKQEWIDANIKLENAKNAP
jgi:hypothetical protein